MASHRKHLRAFLAGRGDDGRRLTTVAAFQGFFFTLAAFPELVPSSAWLPMAFESESPDFRSESEGARVREAVIELFNEAYILVEEKPGKLPSGVRFAAQALANFDPEASIAQWSRGFMYGHFWIHEVVGETPLDMEFESSAFVLGFFADRESSKEFSRELINAPDLPQASELVRGSFSAALANYAQLGRERELSAELFEVDLGEFESELVGSARAASTSHAPAPADSASWRAPKTPRVGRNEPCPCGSGKKFKRCCAKKPVDAMRHMAHELRRVQDRTEPALMRYVREELGERYLRAAREEFRGSLEEDLGSEEDQLFIPWLLYNWEPEEEELDFDIPTGDDLDRPTVSANAEGMDDLDDLDDDFEPSVAELYLEFHGRHLNPAGRDFVEKVAMTVNSFHQVLDVEPGRRLLLRDLLLGGEHHVYEEQASRTLRPGLIIYGRVVPFDRVALLVGCGTIPLPADFRQEVEELREAMEEYHGEVRIADVRDFDYEIREMYWLSRREVLQPKLPRLVNSDGETIKLHRVRCKVQSMDEAFAALASLNPMESADEMLRLANLDRKGRIRSIEFPWVKRQRIAEREAGVHPPVLGHLTLKGGILHAEVNSAGRWRRLKNMLHKRLGDSMSDLEVQIESAEEAMGRYRRGDSS